MTELVPQESSKPVTDVNASESHSSETAIPTSIQGPSDSEICLSSVTTNHAQCSNETSLPIPEPDYTQPPPLPPLPFDQRSDTGAWYERLFGALGAGGSAVARSHLLASAPFDYELSGMQNVEARARLLARLNASRLAARRSRSHHTSRSRTPTQTYRHKHIALLFVAVLTVIVLSMSVVQPRWISINSPTAVHVCDGLSSVALGTIFDTKSFVADLSGSGTCNSLTSCSAPGPCIPAVAGIMIELQLTLVLLSVLISLLAILLELCRPKHPILKALRKNATFFVVTAMFCVTTNVLCYLTAHLLRAQILRKQQTMREALSWQTTRPSFPSSSLSNRDLEYSAGNIIPRTPLVAQLVPLKMLSATERTDDYSRDPGVAFDGGFYLVASAALLSVIACAIVLLSRAFPRVVTRTTSRASSASATSAATATRSRPAAASSTPSSSTSANSSNEPRQEERTRSTSRLTRFGIIRSLFGGRRTNAPVAVTSTAPDAADFLENSDPPPYADDTDQELLLATPEPAPPLLELLDAPLPESQNAESRFRIGTNSPPEADEAMQTADDVPLLQDVGGAPGCSAEQQPPSTAPIARIPEDASTIATGNSSGISGSASSSTSALRPRAVRFASPLVALEEEEMVASVSAGWRSAARPGRPALRSLASPPEPSASANAVPQPQPDTPPPDYSP